MDRYAVLVFHDQDITDEQQIAFTRNFGEIENRPAATSPSRRKSGSTRYDRRLQPRQGRPAAGARRPPPAVQSRQPALAFRQLVPRDPGEILAPVGRVVVEKGGNTEFADMRAAYDALDDETKAQVEDLVCEHSLMYSRGLLGFAELTEEERAMFRPVRQRLVRTHPVTGRKSLYPVVACRHDRRLADARGARLPARPQRARDAAAVRLCRIAGGSTIW